MSARVHGAPELPDRAAFRRFGLPLSALALLALTAVLSLTWSHFKLLNQDEFFVLQTDSVRTYSEMVRIQHQYPISLDPLVYHSLAYVAIKLFGAGAFALRLPSLLGFLLMQVCLFFLAKRIAGERAGVVALALPALTQTFFYSAEGRPYGLLLGFYALALLSWQRATRNRDGMTRAGPLAGLAVAVALTLNSHFFGVLLLIPLWGAELYRSLERRRVDIPVVAAIIAGMACLAFTLPFQRAAGEFRKHYYNAGTISLHAVTQAYRSLFVDYTRTSMRTQHMAAALFVAGALALAGAFVIRWQRHDTDLPKPEAAFLILLAGLPFFGFLLARFVTHSIEVRYVLGAIIGVTLLAVVAAVPYLQRPARWPAVLLGLALALVCVDGVHIRGEAGNTRRTLSELAVPAAVKRAVLASPDGLLYMQNMGKFEVAQYYQPDLELRKRTAVVYSPDREIRLDGHDTEALTALHMQRFTGLRVVRYEDLKSMPGAHVFVLYHSGWDWTDEALAEDGAKVKTLGPAMGGDAAAVEFQ
jgi:4-amino-4-deoxy-L-arabinose transferase-like glycosyltransferase